MKAINKSRRHVQTKREGKKKTGGHTWNNNYIGRRKNGKGKLIS